VVQRQTNKIAPRSLFSSHSSSFSSRFSRAYFMRVFIAAIAALLVLTTASSAVYAQRRDYLTEQEIELVRDNQDIDKRVDVLTKMIDRRFIALGIEVGGWKQARKDSELWGEVRTGTRPELLSDIRQLLQKAIDDIDDVAEHNDSTLTQNKTEGLLFPKSVRDLAAASSRYLPALRSMLVTTKDERERGLILTSIESCESILESVTKLPPEPTKADKKKT
jgi:hypothetical protein